MVLNIQPIIERIRETDFASASIAKARAIYGILDVLRTWVEDGSDLIQQLTHSQPDGFLQDEQTIEGYGQSDVIWAALPLKERLLRLKAFYQTDIHQLSGGDDRKARQLLATAERTFGQCRKEAFEHCDSQMEEYLLCFHVLCLARPGYRNPANVRLYLDYNRFFDALPIGKFDEDSDLAWQYREVRWRRNMLHEQHSDLSLLPGLSFADKDSCETFRLQCYKWMLDLDPENDGSVQMEMQNQAFASECVHSLYAWIGSKYANNITLAPEIEAIALLTIYCGMNIGSYSHHLLAHVREKAYDLLDRLPVSKLRTHLAAHVAMLNEDTELIDAANADIANWDKTKMSQEYQYLVELQ